jgi:hypothetical protein
MSSRKELIQFCPQDFFILDAFLSTGNIVGVTIRGKIWGLCPMLGIHLIAQHIVILDAFLSTGNIVGVTIRGKIWGRTWGLNLQCSDEV